MRKAWQTIKAGLLIQFRQQIVDMMTLLLGLVQPLVLGFILVSLNLLRHVSPDIIVIGIFLTSAWSSTLVGGNWLLQSERWTGNLELVLFSSYSAPLLLFGKLLANMVGSLLTLIVTVVYVELASPSSAMVLLSWQRLLAVALAIVTFSVVAYTLAPVGLLTSKISAWINGAEYPGYLLGQFFPLPLPAWISSLALAFLPFWASQLFHLATPLILLVWGSLCCLYWLCGTLLYRHIIRRLRHTGNYVRV